jgi:hypothetical protein
MASSLPDVIIIGAGKCGTTSLHHYLDLHPAIAMSREKELHFFSDPHIWKKGLGWYASQFDARAAIRGDASVKYTAWPKRKGVPERMASVVPEARLLYLVRDPIERILSAWVHRYADAKESRPIEEVLEVLEGNDYVDRSRYYQQLEQYFPYYSQSRIRVLSSEALLTDRRVVLADLFRFLGVDATFDTDGFDRVEHESRLKRRKGVIGQAMQRLAETPPARILRPGTRRRIGDWLYRPFTRSFAPPTLTEHTRDRLRECLAPDVERLRGFTGQRFDQWSL